MSETLATFEAVQDAYRQLTDDGVSVSADRILKITGGSKQTVLRHLEVIRGVVVSDGAGAGAMESMLHTAAGPFLKKILTVARQQAEAEFAGRIRELVNVQAGLIEDVRDLSETNATLENRIAEAESRASGQRSQDEQLTRLLELVEALRPVAPDSKPDSPGEARDPAKRLPLTWDILRLVQSNDGLRWKEVEKQLEAAGHKEAGIQKARTEALEAGLLGLSVTTEGRNLLKGLEGIRSNLVPNKRAKA